MKKKYRQGKFISGQPKYQPSKLDDYANKFYQLGRQQAQLNQQKKDIEQQTMLGALQRLMLLQAQQRVKDLISELDRRQLELLTVIGQIAPPSLPNAPTLPPATDAMGPAVPPIGQNQMAGAMMPPNIPMQGGFDMGGGMPPDMPPGIPPGMPPETLGGNLPF